MGEVSMERKTKKILMAFFLVAVATCPVLKADGVTREEEIAEMVVSDPNGLSYGDGPLLTKSEPKKVKSWKYYFLSALGQILDVVNAR